LRLVVGLKDTNVQPESTLALWRFAEENGGNVERVSLPEADHAAAAAGSFAPALAWFENLATGN
jgi:dipeptidyl aminopeptidase/acylaminoacyl peptidase